MSARTFLIIALLAGSATVPALAQGPAPVARPAAATAAQSDLAPLVAAHARAMQDVGIQKIAARTGKQKRDIQVMTRYGVSYFGWPKNTPRVPFEIQADDAIMVHAS